MKPTILLYLIASIALLGCDSPNDPTEITYSPERIVLTGELAGCVVTVVTIDSQIDGYRKLNITTCQGANTISTNWDERVGKTEKTRTTVYIDNASTRAQAEAKLSDAAKELIGVNPKCDLSQLVATAQTAKAIAAVKEIENLSYEEKLALGVCK